MAFSHHDNWHSQWDICSDNDRYLILKRSRLRLFDAKRFAVISVASRACWRRWWEAQANRLFPFGKSSGENSLTAHGSCHRSTYCTLTSCLSVGGSLSCLADCITMRNASKRRKTIWIEGGSVSRFNRSFVWVDDDEWGKKRDKTRLSTKTITHTAIVADMSDPAPYTNVKEENHWLITSS